MAAATVAVGPIFSVFGNKRVELVTLTDPADTNTYTAQTMSTIEFVFCTFRDASTVAADSYAVELSGNVATLQLAGTARDVNLLLIGE